MKALAIHRIVCQDASVNSFVRKDILKKLTIASHSPQQCVILAMSQNSTHGIAEVACALHSQALTVGK